MEKQKMTSWILSICFILFFSYSIPFTAQDPTPEVLELNTSGLDLPDFESNHINDFDYSIMRLSQIGNDNVSQLKQKGHFNEIVASQNYDGNQIYFEQAGTSQKALLYQKGYFNTIIGAIDGIDNEWIVIQNGNANLVDAEFKNVNESDILFYQDGNQNEINMYEENKNNMDLKILQHGSNMKLTILKQ
jgi:hypothetical protein